MANADDFCQFARLGQTMKIQKCLQAHRVDVNALSLFGESALSTATSYNQILCVEFLLANRADPKLRLSAGHTAIHIACRLGNVPILHMLLSIKKADHSDDEQQREEKHLYSCLRIKDNANLTPVHWAATQESVSKRQKLFAYLDRRMPGVLDSRYNLNWFDSWAKLHPWVIEPIRPTSILKNNEKPSQSQTQDEPSEITSLDMTPKGSNNNYERTPRAPLLANTTNQYNNTFERKFLPSSKRRTQVRTDQAENPPLPTTPKTSCKVTVTSIYHIPRRDQSPPVVQQKPSSSLDTERTPSSAVIANEQVSTALSDRFTYRARRVHIEPIIHFPPPPSDIEDEDDMSSPYSSKRPSHNLLSNIVPSVSTPSSEHSSSQPSTKQYTSSFGFDAINEPRANADTTTHSISDSSDDDDDDESNPIDYICQSTSTLGVATPGAHAYYV